jgi:hypothetical protein
MNRISIPLGLAAGFLVFSCGKKLGFGALGGGTSNPTDSGVDYTGGGGDDDADDTGTIDDTASTNDTGGGDTDTDTDTDDTDTDDTGISIEGTGYSAGDVAYDLSTFDQTGGLWSLHAQYGSVIVLLVGDLYDARTTDTLSAMTEASGDHSGVKWVAFIGQSATEVPCDQTCAAAAATTYGTPTVLWDPGAGQPTYADWTQGNAPRMYIIDQEMVIDWVNFGSTPASQISDKLDDLDR